jgi:hypothetical protein
MSFSSLELRRSPCADAKELYNENVLRHFGKIRTIPYKFIQAMACMLMSHF